MGCLRADPTHGHGPTRHGAATLPFAFAPNPDDTFTVDVLDGITVSLAGDTTSWKIVFGVSYVFEAEPSRPYAMETSQNGTIANTRAQLKLREFAFDYAGTGYFKVEFIPKFRQGYTKTFSGQVLGSTPTDIKPLEDGTFQIKTRQRSCTGP